MNFNKRAFSLTELLIVIVVVGVLFSAILPIMTKRRVSDINDRGKVWQFVSDDDHKDAYFDDGAAIIGRKPRFTDSWSNPYAKLYINANTNQDQIQFRYGENEGILTGLLFADTTGNLGLTSRLRCGLYVGQNACADNFKSAYVGGFNNTFLGNGVGAKNSYAGYSATAVGANASRGILADGSTVVGADSNLAGGIKNIGSGADPATGFSTIVGAQSGKSDATFDSYNYIIDTIALGDHILASPNSQSEHSVLLGSGTAATTNRKMLHKNEVMIGSTFYGAGVCNAETGCRTAKNNVLIGYDVMPGGPQGLNNTTAIGYAACDSVTKYGDAKFNGAYDLWDGYNDLNHSTSLTCIGFNSAATNGVNEHDPSSNKYAETAPKNYTPWERDGGEHIFLGGAPYNGLPGRSVLEVHNIPDSAPTSSGVNPQLDSTVVLNSNLVVRGNIYFPNKDGYVVPHNLNNQMHPSTSDGKPETEVGRDYCGPYCHDVACTWNGACNSYTSEKRARRGEGSYLVGANGRYDWKDRHRCADFDQISGFIIGGLLIAVTVIASIYTGGAALAAGGPLIVGLYLGAFFSAGFAIAGGMFIGDQLEANKILIKNSARLVDPDTGSAIIFPVADNNNTCNEPGHVYGKLIGSSSTASGKGACPNLSSSDIRLKENLSENHDAIEKLLLIQPYNYTFKKDLNKTPQTGVIAQDLQNYFPNSVTEGDDGYLKIRWDEMFFATINSVKSLDSTLTGIKVNIDNIDADIVVISKSQKDIKKRAAALDKQLRKLEEQNND